MKPAELDILCTKKKGQHTIKHKLLLDSNEVHDVCLNGGRANPPKYYVR